MGDQITNVEMGNGQVEISEGAMWQVKLMSRTERKNLLPGVKSIRGRDQRIDRHSRPSCAHATLKSHHSCTRARRAARTRVFSIYNKIYKSPFITDIRWSASGTEIRTPIERRTVRGTADTCS